MVYLIHFQNITRSKTKYQCRFTYLTVGCIRNAVTHDSVLCHTIFPWPSPSFLSASSACLLTVQSQGPELRLRNGTQQIKGSLTHHFLVRLERDTGQGCLASSCRSLMTCWASMDFICESLAEVTWDQNECHQWVMVSHRDHITDNQEQYDSWFMNIEGLISLSIPVYLQVNSFVPWLSVLNTHRLYFFLSYRLAT